jgi:hypothetical protein
LSSDPESVVSESDRPNLLGLLYALDLALQVLNVASQDDVPREEADQEQRRRSEDDLTPSEQVSELPGSRS